MYGDGMNVALKLMTADEFLVWCLDQEDRWELVNGMPIRMMTGATHAYDDVVVNLIAELHGQLKGKRCRPKTAHIAARMPEGNVRRPDVTVDCGPADRTALESAAPTVFFEVLSKSTRAFDIARKPEEYKQVPSLRNIVLIDPDLARVMVWERADEATPWTHQDFDGLDGQIGLPAIDVTLPMAAIYEGVRFETDD